MGSDVFQHVGCRLNGLLTNLVHADRVSAVFARHHSARGFSSRFVHTPSLRFAASSPAPIGTATDERILLYRLSSQWESCLLPSSIVHGTKNPQPDECRNRLH